jgi:hypothetical protein
VLAWWVVGYFRHAVGPSEHGTSSSQARADERATPSRSRFVLDLVGLHPHFASALLLLFLVFLACVCLGSSVQSPPNQPPVANPQSSLRNNTTRLTTMADRPTSGNDGFIGYVTEDGTSGETPCRQSQTR